MKQVVRDEGHVKKVLIVEDDLSLQSFWERLFSVKFKKIKVDWAISTEEALKMISARNADGGPYFLIIADLFLAGALSGIDLLNSVDTLNSRALRVLVSVIERNEILNNFGDSLKGIYVVAKPLEFDAISQLLKKIMIENSNFIEEFL